MAYPEYYNELGVSPSADMAEIKKAYHKLAKKYHPDLNSGNKKAEQKLKKINEAYAVLKDFAKRAEYDYFGKQSQTQVQNNPINETKDKEEFYKPQKVNISWKVLLFRRFFALCIFLVYLMFLFSNADKDNPHDFGKMLDNSGKVVSKKITEANDSLLRFYKTDIQKKLLFKAVKNDWIFVLQAMLKMNSDINITDEKGYSLLMYARSGEVAELLYIYGANIKHVAPDKETAYSQAVKNGREDVKNFLAQNGAQIYISKPRKVIRPETWKK